jgi:hypothetical protein
MEYSIVVRGNLNDPRHIELDEPVTDLRGVVEVILRPARAAAPSPTTSADQAWEAAGSPLPQDPLVGGAGSGPTRPARAEPPGADAAAERIHALVSAGDWRRARELLASLDEGTRAHPTLAAWARALAPPDVRVGGPGSGAGAEEDLAWMRQHAAEYRGEWVALRRGQLVAHARDRTELGKTLRERNEPEGVLFAWCGSLDDLP